MAFRSLVITSQCKLEYSLNYLVYRKGLEEKRILLDEIKMIVIDSTQVSITSFLISECLNRKIKIIFSDSKHTLLGEVVPYKNNYYSNRKLKEQLSIRDETKGYLWKEIIKEKISNQRNNLISLNQDREVTILNEYIEEVIDHDATNREGLAAKLYFKKMFGDDFIRGEEDSINTYLNYGYSLILSSVSRAIKMYGYYTEIGIHHIGESNNFNLSCDLMEPIRPLVDKYILKNELTIDNFKEKLVRMLNINVTYNNRNTYLDNAIEEYVEDIISYLKTGDTSKIRFIKYEL